MQVLFIYLKEPAAPGFSKPYLKAPNGGDNGDTFSRDGGVSLSGDTIAVSMVSEGSNITSIIHGADLSAATGSGANSSGAVYIFKRTGSTWVHEAFLKAPNVGASDNFGNTIALVGDAILVSASGEDSDTTGINYGSDLSATNDLDTGFAAVYLFTRSGSTWSHRAYIYSIKE